jgi:outer membrane immunogenic protein
MKKFLLASVALGVLASTSAMAADLPRKAPAPVVVPPYIHNWTGFYIGGHIGGGRGDRCLEVEVYGDIGCRSASGFLGGGQLGFNFQTANNFVFGVELSGSFANLNGDNTSGNLPAGWYFSSQGKSLLLLTGRAGIAFDRALFYFTGGGAWSRNTVDFYDGASVVSVDFDRQGWTIGAGIDYGFSPNWSMAFQYNFVDLGVKDVYITNADLYGTTSNELHMATLRLNYRFGGGYSAPVAARY